ncbi:PREDICTED: uncharacterized protein LOC109344644 [Lupinus angustifolius]|uniref:uncharacterized protein LOC109344644 n=1 Tax=Lupinus angustifolius TaxID=3871 RepID=UPI00092E4686|nr:PREDICTED: uncharacterized protein LOC109344644 [Lupinus angustifolius]
MGQLKFLIVAIDYFTKWIEAEALATITSANIQKFTWRNIITRFGIPSAIVTDNDTQFVDRRFQELLSGLRIKQHFTSVEHPQTNGNNLDEVEEIRERARLREEIIKMKTAAKFNSSVIPRQFDEGTLEKAAELDRRSHQLPVGNLLPHRHPITSKSNQCLEKPTPAVPRHSPTPLQRLRPQVSIVAHFRRSADPSLPAKQIFQLRQLPSPPPIPEPGFPKTPSPPPTPAPTQ